ncbi:MAG: pyridoxal-phosphate dependent enzyme [Acidimicrobiia bacterium]|nr:pyridoxal-phosphate dependent enzyme [Acidimicrobiia bacterium]
MIGPEEITAALGRIAPHVRRTPVLEVAADELGLSGPPVTLKLELAQVTGSFKPRGTTNALLSGSVPAAGVAAASGGNHGQAVAWAARRFGHTATVFVPEMTSPTKRARIAAYGAEVRVVGEAYADAQLACDRFVAETGALRIHPYDEPAVVAGQGTVGLELAEQAPGLGAVLVAVGGGGLIGGVASWYRGRARVVSVEPELSACLAAARAAGGPVAVEVAGVAADSLGARQVGELAWEASSRWVDEAVKVTDASIVAAQHWLWEHCRVAAEPGGATALAALLSGAWWPAGGEAVGVIVCGGNVDPATLAAGVGG